MRSLLLISALAACGSSGGPADSAQLVYELYTADSIAECNYLVESYPVKTYTCAGQLYPIGFGRDCAAGVVVQATCTATVGDFEQCLKSGYAVTQDELCADLANGTPPVLDASCTAVDTSDCGN
jgi:hypothetical protein